MSEVASQPARLSLPPAAGERARPVGRKMKVVALWLVFGFLALSTLYPLYFLAATALRTKNDYTHSPAGIPRELTFDNVTSAFRSAHMLQDALNSLYVVIPAVALTTILACLAAYAFVHFQFPLRRTGLLVVVALIAVPQGTILIPLFKVVLDAGLLNHRLGLTLVYAALSLPFSIYLLASFMRAIPTDLLNAAKVDGAGALRTLWSVVLPLIRPGLLTLTTLLFLNLWNEFLFSLVILQKEADHTIMVGIAQAQGHFERNLGIVSAGLLLSMIPPLLIFVFFQRSLAQGLGAGALK
jgi:ABC-type glycerol-3-phosphate transport system permease component